MYWYIRSPTSELYHYGVKGMKWGVRRTPEQLGHKLPKKAKTINLEKWGKTPNTNVLFITGRSGSGKSTLAKSMADDKTDLIHLDLYFEPSNIVYENENRSLRFDKFLEREGIKRPGTEKAGTSAFGKLIDDFEIALEKFGKEEYKNGRKVIAEGIQIADKEGLYLDKKYYRDKPLIIVPTSNLKSSFRAMKRDKSSVSLFLRRLTTVDYVGQDLSTLFKESGANIRNGRDWVKRYLRED